MSDHEKHLSAPHDPGQAGRYSDEEVGYAHVASPKVMLGVFAALVCLTVVTVGVTQYDIGPTGNLVVAMIVATIKAGLVAAFFMHLIWDRRFHLLLFGVAILEVVLFLGGSIQDRSEYQMSIDRFEQAQPSKPMQ